MYCFNTLTMMAENRWEDRRLILEAVWIALEAIWGNNPPYFLIFIPPFFSPPYSLPSFLIQYALAFWFPTLLGTGDTEINKPYSLLYRNLHFGGKDGNWNWQMCGKYDCRDIWRGLWEQWSETEVPQHLSYLRGVSANPYSKTERTNSRSEIYDYDTHTFLDHEFQNRNHLIS